MIGYVITEHAIISQTRRMLILQLVLLIIKIIKYINTKIITNTIVPVAIESLEEQKFTMLLHTPNTEQIM